jgi:glutamate-1-semialdehyde 2,1-aminomutase
MAAALACLRELEACGAIAHMERVGVQLRRGVEAQAATHRLPIVYSGPPALPFLTFTDDVQFARSRIFAAVCAERGVYLAPYHNWFLSAAHSDSDIDRVLEVTDEAFAAVARQAPTG